MWRWTLASVTNLSAPVMALACPFCEGINGQNPVKEEIFSGDWWYYGGATLLPFIVSIAVVGWVATSSRERTPRD